MAIAFFISPVALPNGASTEEPPVMVAVKRDFYPLEVWEPGKQRRWMRNGGEIELFNRNLETDIDLRFMAESFHAARQLTVLVGVTKVMTVRIPAAASRYVVVKRLRVPPGTMTLRFEAMPGPTRVNQVIKSSDRREVSIAFGPFSSVPSASLEGQIEQTGAFPEANRHIPIYSDHEDAANDLRRQGRPAEALAQYRKLMTDDIAGPLSYVWAGLCALILGEQEEAHRLFRGGQEARGSAVARKYVAQAAPQLDEFVTKSELIRRADPVSGLRTSGQIYRAVPEYQAILQKHPDDDVANFWLGFIYAMAERPVEARARFDEVIRSHPKSYDAEFLNTKLKLSVR